ncbi:MAG: dihydrodipicolinate synthase family protein [Gemmatimonadetes bacterium]|nr:dihydrodipicolinate synthase family protein [Gemmatimonadota bacterium]
MTVRDRLRGVLAPLTTPFDAATGDPAAVPLRSNARAVLEAGATGVVVGGSTGEAPLLGEEEYRRMVGWLREVVPDDRLLIVGAGRESTRATVTACREGAEQGADAALVRTPAYYAPSISQRALIDHFRTVADESPIPVLVYNIPKYTNLPIADAVLTALATHQNIVGAKDSCGDLKNFAAYRDAVPDWALFIGSGALLYAALELGAVGGILAVADFAAELAVAVAEAFERGDKAASGRSQERLMPLHKEIVAAHGPAGVKCAMDAVGLAGGSVRPPLRGLSESEAKGVAALIGTAELVAA